MSNHQQIAAALGLDPAASADDIRATGARLDAFLATAPEELSGWATRQRRLAQQAVNGTPVDPETMAVDQDLDAVGLDEDQLPEPVAVATGATPVAVRKPNKALRPLALAAVTAAVVMGVFYMSPKGNQPTGPQAQASDTPVARSTPKPVDPEMVKALEAKIKADPKDVLSMKALGEVYGNAGEYAKAAGWQQRVTQVTPNDVDAWLALGVAQFNGADLDDAEKSWTHAAKLAPKRAEIYYNLGFLWFSKGNQDKASEYWQKVVELDPKSDLAQTVQSHTKAGAKASGSAAATGSAAPSR